MRTPEEFAKALKEANPDKRLAFTTKGAVGWFANNQWWTYAAATIDGQWIDVSTTGMPLVNGEPAIKQTDWQEI